MKKRILISTYYMQIGGVERSLLGLLNSIDYTKFSVDLFIYSHTGEFMNMIPEQVNVLPEDTAYKTLAQSIKDVFLSNNFFLGICRLLAKVSVSLYNKSHNIVENYSASTYIAKFSMPFLPSLHKNGEYDLAISFLIPHNIIQKKVKAKVKIGWIHSDYSYVGLNQEMELPIWSKFDYIASISDDVEEAFLSKFPSLKNKMRLIENILSPDFVRKQAMELDVSNEMHRQEGDVLFCSVGRFSKQKNFINAVRICKLLLDLGVKVKWYLVGYGPDENKIINEIQALNLSKYFVVLGKKVNPYPYMYACDFYIQPSLYEGKAVTVREAQMLYKPVVITDFPTSKSQVINNYNGVIVPMDNKKAAIAIYEFIMNKYLQNQIVDNLKNNDFGNEKEINKIYNLL